MIASFDISRKGYIEFPDFLASMLKARHPEEHDSEAEFREAFGAFDRDGTGKISRAELKAVLTSIGACLCKRFPTNLAPTKRQSLGDDLNEDEIDKIIHEVDVDGDGLISYEGKLPRAIVLSHR